MPSVFRRILKQLALPRVDNVIRIIISFFLFSCLGNHLRSWCCCKKNHTKCEDGENNPCERLTSVTYSWFRYLISEHMKLRRSFFGNGIMSLLSSPLLSSPLLSLPSVFRLQLYSADGYHGACLLCKLRISGHKFLCCFKVNVNLGARCICFVQANLKLTCCCCAKENAKIMMHVKNFIHSTLFIIPRKISHSIYLHTIITCLCCSCHC